MNLFLYVLLFGLTSAVPPMVFIPGFSSSGIEYQLIDADTSMWCNHTTKPGEWFTLWPFPHNLTAAQELCFTEILQIHFNTSTNAYDNRKGVVTRTYDMGGFDGIPGLERIVPYYCNDQLGWVLGETFFGAPFDFRYSSSGLESYFNELKALIEKVYIQNNETKVVLFAISLGPSVGLAFLHRMEQAWKDKYISWFLAESPVWGGTFWPLLQFTAGLTSWGHGNAAASRAEAQFMSVTPWEFPRAGDNATRSFTKDYPVISTPNKNYSAFDYDALMVDIGLTTEAAAGVKHVVSDTDLFDFAHPGCDTFVTFGSGLHTTGPAVFPKDFDGTTKIPLQPTSTANLSGDGLVPVRSSLRGTLWAEEMAKAGKKLYYKEYPNQPHADCCYTPGSPQHGGSVPDDGCFSEALALVVNGTVPPGLMPLSDRGVRQVSERADNEPLRPVPPTALFLDWFQSF